MGRDEKETQEFRRELKENKREDAELGRVGHGAAKRLAYCASLWLSVSAC